MRTGSVCTGYAGLDMAVHEVLGGELVWVADIDPGASAILAHRFPSVPNLGDIGAVDWSAVEPVNVLTAGFPCQDVSCAGGRAGLREGNRTGVWAHVARAIDALRPSLVVLENVRGLLTFGADSNLEPCPWCMGDSGDESALRACGAVLADLADLGFDAEWALVSAVAVGAPHRRERVFIVAWPAADAYGSTERPRTLEAGSGLVAAIQGDEEPGRGRDRQHAAAEDADRATRREWRIAAPGETESRGAWADAGGRGRAPAADTEGAGCGRSKNARAGHGAAVTGRRAAEQPERPSCVRATEWGPYTLAIRRWEHVTGRSAPRPTDPGRTGERLSPRFVEWMMGLPEGWVTDVPGLSRNAQLKALGNGVVPQQAAMALRMLLDRAGIPSLVTDGDAA